MTNPVANDPAAIKEGASLFRANCSPCHGMNAKGGGRGPDLTSGRWSHGGSDEEVFRTITQGVAGTQMPANDFDEAEVWSIIAYVKSVAPAKKHTISGNAENGRKLFQERGCASCHMVKGEGGLLGPELTRAGASRSEDYLITSIREPDKDLSDGMMDPNNHYANALVYDTVIVTLKNGETITGVAKNEDTFSLQLMDTDQKLRFLQKKDVKEVRHEHKSLMPAYSEQMLTVNELQDLLAYLTSLRGE